MSPRAAKQSSLRRRIAQFASSPAKSKRRGVCEFESLETRMALDVGGSDNISDVFADAPTFEPTPVEPSDPGSVVVQATLLANNDELFNAYRSTTVYLDVAANDLLPTNDPVRVTRVSEVDEGISVSIGEDGRTLVITPRANAGGKYDFTYKIESQSGKQGTAVVSVHVQPFNPQNGAVADYLDVLEDSIGNELFVLANDRAYSNGTITAITGGHSGSSISIVPGGKHVIYTPAAGIRSDNFTYTVRIADGTEETVSAHVSIRSRYYASSDWYEFDRDSPAVTLPVLANDRANDPAESPRIISVGTSQFGSRIEIGPDGRTLIYQAPAGLVVNETISYTVRYGPAAHHVSTATVYLNTIEPLLAVDDWFHAQDTGQPTSFNVLANDISRPGYQNVGGSNRTLSLVSVSPTASGGQISFNASGIVSYTPPRGYRGPDSFTYVVRDSAGREQQATALVEVGGREFYTWGPPTTLRGDAELTQYLLENAVRQWQSRFGQTEIRQVYLNPVPEPVRGDAVLLGNGIRTADYSSTNTQVAGIDEADVVETDGDFVYAIAGDELIIVDMRNLDAPHIASVVKLAFGVSEMYLIGDRLVLIDRGRTSTSSLLLTLDVSDRTQPTVKSRVAIDGRIVDTRAIGGEVTFVVDANIGSMQPRATRVGTISNDGSVITERWQYETLAEFTARARAEIIAASMPHLEIYDAAGDLVETRQIAATSDIDKPQQGRPNRLTVVGVFNALADVDTADGRGVSTVGRMNQLLEQIYMSDRGVYVLDLPTMVDRGDGTRSEVTKISFFRVIPGGHIRLDSSYSVRGQVINQFALDEYNGVLRIATTERVLEASPHWRLLRTENHLFTLEFYENGVSVRGSLQHLAPTQTIRSVRFVGDMAYVSTARQNDPLLTVDLSDPASPRLRGVLAIPGFANYLHPVGGDYLIAFGREDRPTSGTAGAPQVSLFYVGDPDNPQLVDRLTMTGASQTFSEAFNDHHAVAYFAEYGVLSLPINWHVGGTTRSAAWLFDVDVDEAAGTGSLDFAGRIDHNFVVRRSLRIDDALVTVSAGELKVNSIHDISMQRANLYIGAPLVADTFTVNEDSTGNTLAVLANDHLGPYATIAEVKYEGDKGTFSIAPDGRSLLFTPIADFFGVVTAKYIVNVPGRGPREASLSVIVTGVADAPRPVNDRFDALPGATTPLDVLRNDVDPDQPPPSLIRPRTEADLAQTRVATLSDTTTVHGGLSILPYSPLRITAVSATLGGGVVTISENGEKLFYTPPAGYTGEDSFSYTVRSHGGLTAEATVTIVVGDAPATDAARTREEARRLRRAEANDAIRSDANANRRERRISQGVRVTAEASRRIGRDAAAAHDAALQTSTDSRQAARNRRRAAPSPEDTHAVAPNGVNPQAADSAVVVRARRASRET